MMIPGSRRVPVFGKLSTCSSVACSPRCWRGYRMKESWRRTEDVGVLRLASREQETAPICFVVYVQHL